MDTEAPPASTPRIGIWIVVILTAWRAGVGILQLLAEAKVIDTDVWRDFLPVPIYPNDSVLGLISQTGLVILVAVGVLTIWGLLTRRTWGWTLAIVTAGIVLALNIGWWLAGE